MKIRGRAAARRAELAKAIASAVGDELRPYGPSSVVDPNRFVLPQPGEIIDDRTIRIIRGVADPIVRELSEIHLMHAHTIIGQAERIAREEIMRHMIALREALGLARMASEPPPPPPDRDEDEDDATRTD